MNREELQTNEIQSFHKRIFGSKLRKYRTHSFFNLLFTFPDIPMKLTTYKVEKVCVIYSWSSLICHKNNVVPGTKPCGTTNTISSRRN